MSDYPLALLRQRTGDLMVQLIESMTWGEIVIACGVAVWFVGLALYAWINRDAGTAAMGREAMPPWLQD